MKIALISDELTYIALKNEVSIQAITPVNYKTVLSRWKPDLLMVESAWQGYGNTWKFKIASYRLRPWKNNIALKRVVRYAKELGIPTVFWNKEDSVHFDRFIKSARLFDHIFTVDENAVPKYRAVVDSQVSVNTLMFAVQPQIHHFSGFDFKYNQANFIGSYSTHIHERRREWQHMMFESVCRSGLGLTIYDRNSERLSENYRYPELPCIEINPAISYMETAQIYKDYTLSLNVNTIEDSPTMFSRRLIEILACGGVAVTNPTLATETMFEGYCHVVSTEEEMQELFYRVNKFGLNEQDKEMAKAGAEYVAKYHTWRHRLEEVINVIK